MKSAWELFEHELRSLYDGHRRAVKTLDKLAASAANSDLKKILRELKKSEDEHLAGTEELFRLLDDPKTPEKAAAVQGMIDELKSIQSSGPSNEVLDVAILDTASHLTQHTLSEYETIERLAERAGIHQTSPRVGDIVQNTLKDLKKASKKLNKLSEQLVQQLRPA